MSTFYAESHQVQKMFPGFDVALARDVAKNSMLLQFAEGDELMKPGQNIKSILLVLDGLIKVFREDENGNEIFMYHLEPGQACALSILCSAQHRASEIKAMAAKPSEVLAIPIQYIDKWMSEHPSWYQFVLSTYRNRFEELLNTIDDIAFRNMDERLILYLKRHQQISNTSIIPLTHAQIATELNTSREVISRLLKKLEEKGLIKLNRQNIELINLNKISV